MSTKLEALVNVLKADGVEEEIIEQLIVDNFTKQYLPEYDVNETTYEVLTQAEIDDQLYELAEGEADDLKSDMEEILDRRNNYLMIQMLRTMDNADCINIVLNNYDEDTLGEKLNKTLLLEEAGYFIYVKE